MIDFRQRYRCRHRQRDGGRGLANGDTVTFNNVGAIKDSTNATMLAAGALDGTYTISNVGANSYDITLASPAGAGTQATGGATFASNPSVGDTITLNGQLWTFSNAASNVATSKYTDTGHTCGNDDRTGQHPDLPPQARYRH